MCEDPPQTRAIEIILKVSERCNLVCSYCYYFFSGDQSHSSKPGRISRDTIDRLAIFLSTGADRLGGPILKVVFHGGEPLLMRKADFS